MINGGGIGGGPGSHRASALAWAKEERGSDRWAWRCQRFVEEAYGTRSVFDSALEASRALKLNPGPIRTAPAGAIVFFKADRANRGFGHVGLSLGGGKMISALRKVTITNVAKSRYWRSLYLGWADAPSDWPGRIPPPPALIDDFNANAAVRITSPAPGGEVSGTNVPLMASASGVGGVAFDAYYATDPRDPRTRAWHQLGEATLEEGAWTLHFDTTRIPDQGQSAWGTVNVAAIALDRRRRRTGVRDLRRISIRNAFTPPTIVVPQDTGPGPDQTPQEPPQKPPGYWETTGGNTNTWTDYLSGGGTQGATIPAFTTVQVECRIEGLEVEDGNTWWYRIRSAPWNGQFYASADAFYNNGQTNGSLIGTPFVDESVPLCTDVFHYNCPFGGAAIAHTLEPNQYWGNDFVTRGTKIVGGTVYVAASNDNAGEVHEAWIGIYPSQNPDPANALARKKVEVPVGGDGIEFTFDTPVNVAKGTALFMLLQAIDRVTIYDQDNSATTPSDPDGCVIGTLTGTL